METFFRIFLNTFGYGVKKYRLFVVFFRPVGRNNNLHIQRDSSMKNNFSKNLFCSDNFRTMSEKFLAVWQVLFDWVVKTACYVSVATFRGEETLEKKIFVNFGFWTKIFWSFCRIFLRGVVKTAFNVSIGTFWKKKYFAHKNCILPNSHKQRTFLGFGWNFSDGVFKTAFYVFIKTISQERFLEKTFIPS